MRLTHLLLAAAIASTQLAAPAAAASWRPLPLHVGGRVVAHPRHDGGTDYLRQWPGTYWEGAFRGDRLAILFDDPRGEYRVTIDAQPPLAFPQPGTRRVELPAGGAGEHRVRVEVVTEDADQPGRFGGVLVPRDAVPEQVPPRARQIEYVGDSSMSGYGARAGRRDCPGDMPRLTSDTADAYPAVVARHYDADYQVNAVSGRGLTRNYGGIAPDGTLPLLYPYALFDKSVRYEDPAWRPQIVVIKLSADFVGQPAMSSADLDALFTRYVNAYAAFIADLHARHPQAAVLVWWFDTPPADPGAPAMNAAQAYIRARAAAAGVRAIDFLPMHDLGFDGLACDRHPSLADHRRTAAWLEAYLDKHPDLWGDAPAQ